MIKLETQIHMYKPKFGQKKSTYKALDLNLIQQDESEKIVENFSRTENGIWLFSQNHMVIIPRNKGFFNLNNRFNFSSFFYRRVNKPFHIKYDEDYVEIDRGDQKNSLSAYLKNSDTEEISSFIDFIKGSSLIHVSEVLIKRKKLESLGAYFLTRDIIPPENKYYHLHSCCVFEEGKL